MTKPPDLRDNFHTNGAGFRSLDPRIEAIVRLLARAQAKQHYDALIETGEQPY